MRVRATVRRLTAMLSACVVLLAAAPPAAAAPVIPAAGYGFSEGSSMLDLSPDDLNRELDAVSSTSASWLRVLIDWSKIETEPGRYDWVNLDRIVNAAAERHLNVLGNIGFTPSWARPALSFFTAPPDDPRAFAEFAKVVVNRYGAQIKSWEIWNEPNLPLFFGFGGDRAARYTALLKAAYPAIKSVQPGSTVIAAGLSRGVGPDSPPSFLNAMYAAGVKGSFDAAALHPYVFPDGLSVDPENGWSDVGRVHDLMVAQGDGGKKIWMTEFGAPTSAPSADGVDQQNQARQITDILWATSQLDYSGPAFIYSIRDLDSGMQGNREANFGALLTSEWQPKVAASALAS